MSARLIRPSALLALCAGLLLVAGCLQTEFYDSPADAAAAQDADAAQDVAADSAADALDAVDAALDSTAAETDGGVADGGGDASPDASDVTGDSLDADVADVPVDTGPALLPVGHTCSVNAECDSDLCLSIPGAPKVCSKTCDGNCPAGMRCGLDVATGSTAVPYCLPLPGKLCQACSSDADCGGDPCVPLAATKESLCGVACGSGGVCPSGFVCQSFKAGEVCVPQLGTCSCSGDFVGQAWACSAQSPLGKCVGAQTCGSSGWSACSAPVPSPELCDGQDNDCNGQVDEAYAALGSPCGIGACFGGKFQCSADKKGVVCSTEVKKPAKDLCNNGLDDNCDGKTDEGCPPKDTDQDGTPDLSDCGPYLAQVRPGATEPCCAALPGQTSPSAVDVGETTKGCDVNCDGKVIACAATDKDKDGYPSGEDCNDTNAAIHPKAADKCGDGVDQDCNGADPLCTPINDQDGDGYTVDYDCDDSTNKLAPGNPEVCNAIDDDCDGIVDDGNPGGGASCGASVGACKAGTMVCTGVGLGKAVTVSCVDASLGEPEVCNGKDDNCDGKTDETFLDQGLGAACDTLDADMCANGVKVCQADGVSLTCGAEKVYDILETCKSPGQGNGVDENCNGQTDESCYGSDLDGDGAVGADDCNELDAGFSPKVKVEPCCDPALGAGEAAIKACDKNCDGKIVSCDGSDSDRDGFFGKNDKGEDIDCNAQDPTSHPGAPELCGDGIDQDCDGADVDCAAISDDDGDKYANSDDCKPFDAKIFPGAVEICNGKDDDCDGAIDEGNPGGGATCGSTTGACQAGLTVCTRVSNVAQVLCVPKIAPKAELCNGLDDNCNGQTDESFADLGLPCDGADADKCPTGTWSCSADGKSTACNNETQSNLVELCDGLDNDCNGKTDEGLNYFGKQVGADCDGLGLCGGGKVVCSPELQVPVCSTDFYGTESQAKDEACNAKDDDCDGLTDEGMTFGGKGVGQPCQAPGACAGAAGSVECGASGKAICSTMSGGSKYAGKAEVCDGIDNDCDGHIDEGMGVKDSTCKQVGVCNQQNVSAKCVGAAWQCGYQSVSGYQPDKEYSCDGLDNDCDGQTDEDFLIGKPCDGTDSDSCQNGTWTCGADKASAVCANETATDIKESCNGKDDNCDGKTDEDFAVGQPCDGGDNDQCKNGLFACTSDGSNVVCGKETVESIVEICNELDDNCDGQTDEGYTFGKEALGSPCDGADSDQCKNGVVSCSADKKSAVCGTESKSNIVEICDEIDNDCDGKTDEEQLYQGGALGAACTGIGSCPPGNVVCSPKTFKATCSTNPDAFLIFNGAELCDGLDNDCNGKTDDNLSYKGYILGGNCPAIGICGAGVVECGKSEFGSDKQVVCSTHMGGSKAQAKAETCNGKDDDCDGLTDEDLTLADSTCGKVGVCAGDKVGAVCKNGAWECDYSKIPPYETAEKQCDGLDNDCDGQTDEGYNVGQACDGPDSDACKKGTWSCATDGKSAVCLNEEQQDIAEVCDGSDNDCDGKTDEEFTYGDQKLPLGASCDGVGVCGVGKVVCGKFQTATCSTDPDGASSQAKPESCDNLDNDCDGQTDNGLKFNGLPVGAPCSGVGECGNGVVECAGGVPVCSVNPDGANSQAKAELCNAKDDDCDGQTDEQLDPKKSSCNQLGVCANLLQASCLKGAWKCAYDQTPGKGFEKPEVSCDDLDNDCNGVTDDPYPAKGKACDGPDADLCKSGSYLCTSTKLEVECVESGGGASAEICDGKDNDCNGFVDEPFPTLGQACDGLDSDQCPNGVLICSKDGKGVVCGDEFIVNLVEVCDGKDNDCNGQTDEGLKLGEACDGSDNDQCKNGTFTCGAGAKVVCENESLTNIVEACNGKDDDCDGQTDEGFTQVGKKCDLTSDLDDCATGTFQCTAGGAVACVGDVACVGGVPCVKSASASTVDACICNGTGQNCNVDQGNMCNANGSCTCGSNAACPTGKKCSGGTCK